MANKVLCASHAQERFYRDINIYRVKTLALSLLLSFDNLVSIVIPLPSLCCLPTYQQYSYRVGEGVAKTKQHPRSATCRYTVHDSFSL